jgi:hypothetical protein
MYSSVLLDRTSTRLLRNQFKGIEMQALGILTIILLAMAAITINSGIMIMYHASASGVITPVAMTTRTNTTTTSSSNVLPSSLFYQKQQNKQQPPQTINIHFDTNTKIKDIVSIHNLGLPFDRYISKISQDMKNQTPTMGQTRAWNYIKSLLTINADICSLNQMQNHNQQQAPSKGQASKDADRAISDIMNSNNLLDLKSVLPPLPSKQACDSKMAFAYEVCQGDPTIPECNSEYPSQSIKSYIKSNNLHGATQIDNLAYEELEEISIALNHSPDNSSANIVHFTNSTAAKV